MNKLINATLENKLLWTTAFISDMHQLYDRLCYIQRKHLQKSPSQTILTLLEKNIINYVIFEK